MFRDTSLSSLIRWLLFHKKTVTDVLTVEECVIFIQVHELDETVEWKS